MPQRPQVPSSQDGDATQEHRGYGFLETTPCGNHTRRMHVGGWGEWKTEVAVYTVSASGPALRGVLPFHKSETGGS